MVDDVLKKPLMVAVMTVCKYCSEDDHSSIRICDDRQTEHEELLSWIGELKHFGNNLYSQLSLPLLSSYVKLNNLQEY